MHWSYLFFILSLFTHWSFFILFFLFPVMHWSYLFIFNFALVLFVLFHCLQFHIDLVYFIYFISSYTMIMFILSSVSYGTYLFYLLIYFYPVTRWSCLFYFIFSYALILFILFKLSPTLSKLYLFKVLALIIILFCNNLNIILYIYINI